MTPPHDLERLWKVPIDPCNVQLGGTGAGIVLALQPLPIWASVLAVALLSAAGIWWAQVHEKRSVPWAPKSMDDPRTGTEWDNPRDVILGAAFVFALVFLRGAYTICE